MVSEASCPCVGALPTNMMHGLEVVDVAPTLQHVAWVQQSMLALPAASGAPLCMFQLTADWAETTRQ
eukprot:670215-Amphidinium_carterae.1